MTKIPASALYLRLPSTAGKEENLCPLLFFVSCPDGRSILHKISKKNYAFLNAIPASVLISPCTVGSNTNMTIFFLLCNSSVGMNYLLNCFTNNIQLLRELPSELVYSEEPEKGFSAFHLLSSTLIGHKVLLALLKNNTKIAEHITIKTLFKPPGKDVPLDENSQFPTCSYYLLKKTEAGRQVLDLLKKQNPLLADGIQEKLKSLSCNPNTSFSPKSPRATVSPPEPAKEVDSSCYPEPFC